MTARKLKPAQPSAKPKPGGLPNWGQAISAAQDGKSKRPCSPPPGLPCVVMSAALRGSDGVGLGVEMYFVPPDKTKRRAERVETIVVYRRARRDVGLRLHFCPWCGGELREGAVRWGDEEKPPRQVTLEPEPLAPKRGAR